MGSFLAWLKRVAIFVAENGDAFLAILVAACVIAAEAFGNPSAELVDSAILALLGAVAVAILRDRSKHSDLSNGVAREAMSGSPGGSSTTS